MRVAALLLLASSACSQIFGLDAPQVTPADAPRGDGLVDTVEMDAAPDAGRVTVSFQQGVNLYANAKDTWIDAGTPNQIKDTDAQLRWRASLRWALLEFNAIFGATSGRIPQGSTIVSAQLEIMLSGNNCTADIREVLISWADTDTYNTFGPSAGVDPGDIGPVINPVPTANNIAIVDVTSSLTAWRADPTMNHGWILEGLSGADCIGRSSEDGVPANRPKLVVTYQ